MSLFSMKTPYDLPYDTYDTKYCTYLPGHSVRMISVRGLNIRYF